MEKQIVRVELELENDDDGEQRYQLIDALESSGFDATFQGQGHDHTREAELIEYKLDSVSRKV